MQTDKQTLTYVIDGAHSAAHFSVRHLMISKVRGNFRNISGTLQLPAGSAVPSDVNVQIDAASLDTREAQRDGHLRSPDFFDVDHFPKLNFDSTSVRRIDDAHYEVTGDLQIHGVTKSINVTVEVSGQGRDPWGNDRIAYETAFKISRKEYGLVWNQVLEAGGVTVGDEIDISLDVEAIPKPD